MTVGLDDQEHDNRGPNNGQAFPDAETGWLDARHGGGGPRGGKKNFDPVAENQAISTTEAEVIQINLLDSASDKNGDALSVSSIDGVPAVFGAWTQLASGASYFLQSDGTLFFDPMDQYLWLETGESALETLSFEISDGRGGSATAELVVEIEGVSEPSALIQPDAVDDYVEVGAEGIANIRVLENDIDAFGGGLRVVAINGEFVDTGTVVVLPSGAKVSVNSDGTLSYDRTEAQNLTEATNLNDEFTYSILDDNGLADSAMTYLVDGGQAAPVEEAPYYVDALIGADDNRLNAFQELGTPVEVKFAFASDVPWYYPDDSDFRNGFRSFSESQQDSTRALLDEIEQLTGLTFVEVPEGEATMIFGIADLHGDTLGTAYLPDGSNPTPYASDIWIDSAHAGDVFEAGTRAYATLLHETGHALGLAHPDSNLLSSAELTREFSVLNYARDTSVDVEPESMMLYDVAALQHLYGPGSGNDGDTTYDFGSLAGSVRTVWDSSGQDTFDMSQATSAVSLNLNDGTHSTVGNVGSENLSVAFGATIENAIGSAYDDIIVGNEVNNLINGGEGNDTLSGGAGNDTFGFGAGWGIDTIEDYVVGEDQLDFSGSGLKLEDLFITSSDGSIVISHEENSLRLAGVDREEDSFDESLLVF